MSFLKQNLLLVKKPLNIFISTFAELDVWKRFYLVVATESLLFMSQLFLYAPRQSFGEAFQHFSMTRFCQVNIIQAKRTLRLLPLAKAKHNHVICLKGRNKTLKLFLSPESHTNSLLSPPCFARYF